MQSSIPSQSWAGIAVADSTATVGSFRAAIGRNGLIYVSVNSGGAWTANGPDNVNRTWTSVSTCVAREDTSPTAQRAFVVASAAGIDGGIWVVLVDTSSTTLPTTAAWKKLTGGASPAPADSLAWSAVACTSPEISASTGALYVIATTGGSVGSVWLGTAGYPTASAVIATWGTTAVTMAWADQVPISPVLVAGDYVSVAAATAGATAAAQAVTFAAVSKGTTGRLFTGITVAASVSTTTPTTTWSARAVSSSGVTQTNFVSVDAADKLTGAPPDSGAVPVVVAVGGNHVFSTTMDPAAATPVYILSAYTANWLAVDINSAGTNVAALASGAVFAGSASLTTPGSFVNITITSSNRYSTSNFVDLALVDTVANNKPLTAVVSGFTGNGIAAADMVTGVGSAFAWTPTPQSNGLSLVGLAVAANGTRQAAYEAAAGSVNKVYVSNDGGVTWVLSLTLGNTGTILILDIACDATCTTIAVLLTPDNSGTADDQVYISRNGGVSWGAAVNPGKPVGGGAGARTAVSVAVNAEGTVVYAAASGTVAPDGQIWAINPAGVSEGRATGDWLTIDAGSGGVLAGSKATGQVFLSLDGGVTMPSSGGPFTNVWSRVAVSTDGSKIAVAGVAGATSGSSQVHTGVCTGTTCIYTQQLPTVSGITMPNDEIASIAMSGDGSRLMVGFTAITNGGIWSAAANGNAWTWRGPFATATNDYVGLGVSSNGGIATAIGGTASATTYGFLQGAGP